MAKRAFEQVSLQFVKQIRLQFCPWEKSAKETRSFFSIIATNKVRETNPNCKFKTEVKHDGSTPQVLIEFDDGKKLLFKSEHLMCKEMVQKFTAIQQQKVAGAVNGGP
ncbi:putative 39S ribosomal protein L53, mitochondrial isoform X1 [Apostichopus japonicus]|uniref:Large ribosomal subunit protein mL53 n=1 Tax=Stichopus japonicus TaxID=307972 RepID=A0A2G8JSP0_STIJA|nr:putative 39S ribosomal protein L53, mitochondrial isoform X1 [Apostichopus japonicus]